MRDLSRHGIIVQTDKSSVGVDRFVYCVEWKLAAGAVCLWCDEVDLVLYQSDQQIMPTIDLSRFPHKCLKCGAPAYIGFMDTDCSAGCK